MSNRPLLGPLLGVRPLVADGAMGTMIQAADLTSDDFDGLDGCNEWLNVTRPDVITSIHQAYLAAGAQLITTNTFGANLSALGEYGLSDQLEAIALAGARLARSAADDHASADQPRWVLGSIGPGTRLASLDQLSFAELVGATERQVKAMIDGGIDAVLIETAQDLLGVRAAVVGAQQAMQAAGVDMPIIVSVTVELTGALLVGSDLTAVVASLAPLGIAAIGLNCAAGPDLLAGHLHRLRQLTKLPLTCMPNAGLPTLTPTGAQYPLSPTDFAAAMVGFRQRDGLAVLGGCCGTTPEHIEALVARLTDAAWSESVGERSSEAGSEEQMDRGWVSSLYSATDLTQELSYLSVGERANVAGSKAFREALLADELDKCVAIAHAQVDEGAHVLDVCVDYVGRDAVADMTTLIKRLRGEVDIPLQIDSSDPAVIAVGLELAPGRSIINSVHFESGDGPGSKFAAMMHQARRHGAAVVALCIDEAGQARTVDRKLEVAGRLIEQLTGRYGMDQADILIDCLTFPIATGQADTRHDGRSTIDAITTLKSRYPRVHTILGISNVSFGLKPAARLVLNSVFLAECRAAGLDCAIVHPSKIRPLDQLPPDQVALARQLVLDDGPDSALEDYLALFDREITSPVDSSADELPIDQRLRRHIIGGRANGLADTLAAALAEKTAVDIINQDLLAAMRIVGERFGQGQMQLPFVLKSAEVMKQAVALLEPA
ncbi:MAG: homocysteine S-methyltransferase family protein, partial [Propionibacteriaceae bacterium]|nr:homocysteine S-methyltransferase family protein [Propionibacteriaceae bacterium]